MAYPSKVFHRRLANLDENSFMTGNFKNVPTSKNIIRQCSHEYRQSILIDKDVYQNIQMLTEKYISDLEFKSIPGFIQYFSIQPLTPALWTQSVVEFFHKMSDEHSLVVDATGSIAHKLGGKEMFYFGILSYDRCAKTEPYGSFHHKHPQVHFNAVSRR